jgi:hypothetical protein
LILGLAATLSISAYGDTITVNSSAAVSFLANGTSSTTDFPSAFSTANFTSAQTGTKASALSTEPFYTTSSTLTTDGAIWIGTSAGAGNNTGNAYTALYAISFNIPDAFTSGSITLNYEIDNELGDVRPGVYLNGTALPNSTDNTGCAPGCFSSLQTYTDSSVTADLVQGTNWLYLDGVNLGAEAGLIFSATITTVNATSAVPEPSSYGLMLIGIGLLVLGRKRLLLAFR